MDSAPILLPSPRKSAFQVPYAHEIHEITSSEEEGEDEQYSYDPSPDEAVFDDDSQEDMQDSTSPHTSDDDDLSTMPPEPDSRAPSTIYTPHKRRSPFRNPSSVHNLQLDTTPPHLVSLPSNRRAYQLSSPSRNGTPQSHYSTHSRPRSNRSSPAAAAKKEKKAKKEHPLVLLHLTLLPLALPYSQSLLETVLPTKKLADCKLLKEKLGASVVQERGVLIPHPKDDYDLLEERLLEALELEQGPISRDGHFLLPEDRCPSRAASQSIARIRLGSEEPMDEDFSKDEEDEDTHTEVPDSHLCEDCGKHIYTTSADRRWDIRVYAANGLMREGAWSAAWREMERVDVEIKPFISDELKRELEDRWEDMELLMKAEPQEQSLIEDSSVEVPAVAADQSTERLIQEDIRRKLDEERLKEIYGEQAQAKIESLQEDQTEMPAASLAPPTTTATTKTRASIDEIPITTLLSNYVQLLLRDRRNVAIICLSTVVLLLAVQAAAHQKQDRRLVLERPTSSAIAFESTTQAGISYPASSAAATISSIPVIVSSAEASTAVSPTVEVETSTVLQTSATESAAASEESRLPPAMHEEKKEEEAVVLVEETLDMREQEADEESAIIDEVEE